MDLSRFGVRMWESLMFGRSFLPERIGPFISSVKNGEADVDGTIWIPELRRSLTPLQMIIEHIHSMYDKNEAMSPCAREWHDVYERILAEVLRLDANPDTICQGFGGNTALFYFCENNGLYDRHEKMDIVKLLLQHGANASVYDNNGTSLLHRVAGCRHSRVEREWPELAEALILHGANVNAQDFMGNTALHFSVRAGYIETAHILVQNGADIFARDENGEMPANVHGPNIELRQYLRKLVYRHDMRDVLAIEYHRSQEEGGFNSINVLPPEMMRKVADYSREFLDGDDVRP
jgi:hypothetical protein